MLEMEIVHKVEVKHGQVMRDGVLWHKIEPAFSLLSRSLYEKYCKGYSKFFKMDALSKLGFLTNEVLLYEVDASVFDANEVALVIGNAEATLPTDRKYYETLASIPSPSLFVYTLPNILMGEICIKHGFRGENLFFVSPSFDETTLLQQVKTIFANASSAWSIAGWVNWVDELNYESVLYLIAKNRNNSKFTKP